MFDKIAQAIAYSLVVGLTVVLGLWLYETYSYKPLPEVVITKEMRDHITTGPSFDAVIKALCRDKGIKYEDQVEREGY